MIDKATHITGAMVLALSAAVMSSPGYAREMTLKPTGYAMHLDEIHPAPGIGQSFAMRRLMRREVYDDSDIRRPDIPRPVATTLLFEGAGSD